MCFTPIVSIATATIEVGISAYLFHKIKDRRLNVLAVFVLFLGVYQFTEFMICKSTNDIFWARIGFASYTLMPIMLYHFFINASGGKIKKYFYLIPIFFAALALFYPNFIKYTSCNILHVTTESLIFNQSPFLMLFYLLYYCCLPIYGVYIFLKKSVQASAEAGLSWAFAIVVSPVALLLALVYYAWSSVYENNQDQTWIYTTVLILASVLILVALSSVVFRKSKKLFYQINSLIIATTCGAIVVLYYIVPNIAFNYASIFCQFALLYGISSIYLINALDGKALDT